MKSENIRIVLVETTHAGNIGAAARAMKTMGLADLALVKPRGHQSHDCYARASGADDIIDNASVHEDLQSALQDASWVFGTSARVRSLKWPQYDVRAAAAQIHQYSNEAKVAVVFGRESSGLSNDELAKCSALLGIPTRHDFSSLNLGSAVQIVCYEIMMASTTQELQELQELQEHGESVDSGQSRSVSEAPAEQRELEHFYTHLTGVMARVDFYNKDNPRLLDGRLRRLFNRAGMLKTEVQLLRGFFSAVEKKTPAAGNCAEEDSLP